MNIQEQFNTLLVKEHKDEFISLLKSLDTPQRKSLVSPLKKLNKEYLEYTPVTIGNSTTFTTKASVEQREMLGIASFVCFNLSDFEKSWAVHSVIAEGTLSAILNWYCPSWFNDYINKQADADFISYNISYHWVMELAERGFLSPSPNLLAKLLPESIYESKENTWNYRPEKLLRWEKTLEVHIWYMFEFDTNINWSNRYKQFSKGAVSQETGWINVFKALSEEGKIDRSRLLRESLLATNRNFNKTLSGWFAELFLKLSPSKEELLLLQHELLHVFNSPHSKVVNTALKYIKLIANDKAFLLEEFLENVPLLLASETKATISATLMVLDTLAKKNPQNSSEICEAACQALIHPDDEVQTRTAKLIQKYGSPSETLLQETIVLYYDTLFVNSRNLLQDFVPNTGRQEHLAQEVSEEVTPTALLNEDSKIDPVKTFDELVYLASQAFDNHAPYHFDLLAAALIDLQHDIVGENISKLEPAFQRAYKLLLSDWPAGMGYLDHMLATFFVNYAYFLHTKYPKETESLAEIHNKYMKQDQENETRWSHYNLRIGNFDGWKTYNENPAYEPHKQVLLAVKEKLDKGDLLPLLSTPTHAPGWISPTTLVERLGEYQMAGTKPNSMDFQIALSRCALDNTSEALAAAEKLTGEYRNLMRFLLNKETAPQAPFETPAAWMAASLTKAPEQVYQEFSRFPYNHISHNYLTGQFGWQALNEAYTYNRYDYYTKQNVQVEDTRKILRVHIEKVRKQEPNLKSKLSKLLPFQKKADPLLYEYLTFKIRGISAEHNDIARLLLLIPGNPGLLLAQVTGSCLTYSTFNEEGDKKTVSATISTLFEIWNNFGITAHLFIAACMLSSDKTIRSFAAEVWVKGVSTGKIKSELIGEMIGLQERVEYAPLKRFTDLVISNMFQISAKHNTELEKMLSALLQQLSAEPIKNLKKLLEIFLEVVSLNGSSLADELELPLRSWKKSPGLNKIINVLEQRVTVLED